MRARLFPDGADVEGVKTPGASALELLPCKARLRRRLADVIPASIFGFFVDELGPGRRSGGGGGASGALDNFWYHSTGGGTMELVRIRGLKGTGTICLSG